MELQNFGKYLVQQRELRGLSTEDVAAATRISVSLIGALENGQVEKLPAPVFVINYVRAYANVIGLSPDDTVLRLEEVYRAHGVTANHLANHRKKRFSQSLFLMAVALIAGLIIVGFLLLPRK